MLELRKFGQLEKLNILTFDNVGTAYIFEKYVQEYRDIDYVLPKELLELRQPKTDNLLKSDPKFFNGKMLSLSQISPLSNNSAKLVFSNCDYLDLLITHGSLDHILDGENTIRKKYGYSINNELNLFSGYNSSRLPKPVGISVVVITADNKVLLSKRSPDVVIEPNSWHVSIAEGLEKKDIDLEGAAVDPNSIVTNALGTEMGLTDEDLDKSTANIMGIVFSQKYLQAELAIFVSLTMSSDILISMAKNSVDSWERKELIPVDLKSDTLEKLLKTKKWSPHGYLTMKLLIQKLARNNRFP